MQTVIKSESGIGARSIASTMQAAVYHGKNDVRLETVPVPKIGPGELLVRVHTCGICGTDLKKILTGSHSAPRIFGHEMAGEVVVAGQHDGLDLARRNGFCERRRQEEKVGILGT